MTRANAPVVTGVSPKDGPPGTRITIRGENFGTSASDFIGLLICEHDCTLSAEWKSCNKIIARSGVGKGLGNIIVTTRSGGEGSCTVKFRGYTEMIGPTKESAVWVDTPATLSWARRSLSPSSYQQEDPLGLSVEASEKAIPEDDLNELFPGRCGDLGSEQFSAGCFLLENHHSTNFEDLKAGLAHMKRNIDNQKRGELSFLKANVSSVLDQLETLIKLRDKFQLDVKTFPDFTSRVQRKIEDTKEEAYKLFEDVLARRERADTTRNGLAVLQRFKFLFCLPAMIERNVQKGDFDVIINDYARVRHLFGNTEVALFQKVLNEIEERIEGVRATLIKKLENVQWSSVSSVDDYIKIIRNLLHLEAEGDVAWIGITSLANHLEQSMHELKDKYIILETSENAKKSKGGKIADGKPHRVLFVEELVDLMEMCFPDLWKLAQSYFKGEFNIEIHPSNHARPIFINSITTFCNLLRAAILPHTLNKSDPVKSRQMYGIWSNSGFDAVLVWLPHCLRYFRTCYSCFIRIDLPSDALDMFSKLIFELRLFIVTTLFRQTSDEIAALPKKEDWHIEMHDTYGGITHLPGEFEQFVKKVVQTAHETVLIGDVREMPLMENALAKEKAMASLQTLFSSFANTLEILAFVTDEDQSERGAVISQLIGTSDVPRPHGSCITWEQRLLAVQCNCQFTAGAVIPSLCEVIKSCGFPVTDSFVSNTKILFGSLGQKILDQYHEHKCDPLVGTIEPSMYLSKFDWDTSITPTDIRPYAKEIIVNLIGVRAELYRLPIVTVQRIMCRIVETVAEELARLMSCVKRFSSAGSIQASADIMAVQDATKAYSTAKSNKFFKEAITGIPRVQKENEQILKNVLSNFHSRMALQLLCLNDK